MAFEDWFAKIRLIKPMDKKNKKTKTPLLLLTSLTKELVANLGVKAEVEIKEDKKEGIMTVDIKSDNETGLLIGKRGETVEAIQTILSLMLRQAVGEWQRVVVNVGNYRQKQEDYLTSLAQKTVERVIETNTPQYLYNLNASQRRVVHLFVAEQDGVESESVGEGRERCLVIKPNAAKKKE